MKIAPIAMSADPAMFAGTLLANDMGGWPLAQQLTDDPNAQMLSGLILGAMMGATVVFTIPVALGIINGTKVDDQVFLAPQGSATRDQIATMFEGFCASLA